jgi:hypothetical protein
MIPSGNYMGAIGRVPTRPLRGLSSSRDIDLMAINLGSGLGKAIGADATGGATGSGGGNWETALSFFQVAVEGAPAIITAARDDTTPSTQPSNTTGPSTAYFQAELDRLRNAQSSAQQQAFTNAGDGQIISGVSNGALIGGVAVLGIVAVVAAIALKK